MEKLTGKTADILSENIEKIKQLFPEVFIEGKIDFDMLQKILRENVETDRERYGFTWHGKSDAIKMALKQTTGTLRPNKEDSKHWDTTQNLFIEGDNLEVLRALQESYRGEVKIIYIDPPYNTGRDFIYEDNFSDNIKNYKEKVGDTLQANADSSGRYHTNWLNLMYPRLRLAKNLLKKDGVIFVSIDDNEVHNLRKLCDEIFGEENCVGEFVVIRAEGGGLAHQYIKGHDYLIAYAKQINNFEPLKKPKDIRGKIIEKEGKKYWIEEDWLRKEFGKYGTLFYKDIEKVKGKDKKIEIDEGIKDGHYQLIEKRGDQIVGRLRLIEEDGSKFYSILKHLSAEGNRDLESLGLGNLFDFPKPVSLIKELVSGATFFSRNDNDIILDFFAGSSTTAHAAMQLNIEDGGNRKFIMVQIPEPTPEDGEARRAGYNNIAEVGEERTHRAGELIKHKANKKFDTPEPTKNKNTKSVLPLDEKIKDLDIGFKVFELDETNFKLWDPNTKDIERSLLDQLSPLKEERTDEDAVYEILLKYGIDLTTPITELNLAGKKVFSLADGYLLICLEKKIELETVKEMAKLSPKRVVFYDDGFLDDTVKANAEQTLKKAGAEEIMVI